MKPRTQTEVDGIRELFTKVAVSKEQAGVKGHTLAYFVLPQALNPELPDFAACSFTENSKDIVLGVSDGLPAKFRPYWMLHEYLETRDERWKQPSGCLNALELELLAVPVRLLPEYGPRRCLFFKNLVDYARRNLDEKQITSHELAQYTMSRDRLVLLENNAWKL